MKLPHRIAGNLALDFANTVSWRDTERETDHLTSVEGLSVWARAAGLTHSDDGDPVECGGTILPEARALRKAIGAIGSAFANGKVPPADALAILRNMVSAGLSRADLVGNPLRPRFAERDRLLGMIAWSALELFGGPETARIKECPFHDCRWLFVDRSKNGSRRWCEMATCGNRAKKQAMAASGSKVLKGD